MDQNPQNAGTLACSVFVTGVRTKVHATPHCVTRGCANGKCATRRHNVGMLAAGYASKAISAFPRGIRMHRARVLIVEGEKETCGVLRSYLEDKGYEVSTAATCASTEQIWRTRRPDIAILDYSLSDGNALGLIPRLKAIDASIPIILLTGYGSIDFAVEAVKLGADMFLPKPA